MTGAQLEILLNSEIALSIQQVVSWTDSTTVLTWLKSDSCCFKVFVGARVAEIQDATAGDTCHYVESATNLADDLTWGKPTLPARQPRSVARDPPIRGPIVKGGGRELQEAFAALQPNLQTQLAPQQIHWRFNLPNAAHFGGCCEREIGSVKQALQGHTWSPAGDRGGAEDTPH